MKEQTEYKKQNWYDVIKIKSVYNIESDKWEHVFYISDIGLFIYNFKSYIKKLIGGDKKRCNVNLTIKKRPELTYKVIN